MCVIIIKNNSKQFDVAIAKKSANINPHGLGIVWLDTWKVEHYKSTEYTKLDTTRPFIAHFRYATVGKVGPSNTHPFRISGNDWLMMNGTIRGMGCDKRCDTRELAEDVLSDMPRKDWRDYLETHDSRFVTFNTKQKSYQIYNKEMWVKHDGVWYSKGNVVEPHVMAVYGTLKKGYGNYYSYLTKATHVGSGRTKDKYPLVVSGLPYLIEKQGIGHNVVVDVFRVDDVTLSSLDRLEGHPSWYERKQIPITLDDGSEVTAWIYFNHRELGSETLHETYEKPKYHGGYYDDMYEGWGYGSRYNGGYGARGYNHGSSYNTGGGTYKPSTTTYSTKNHVDTWNRKNYANTSGAFTKKKATSGKQCIYCLSQVAYDDSAIWSDSYFCQKCEMYLTDSHTV